MEGGRRKPTDSISFSPLIFILPVGFRIPYCFLLIIESGRLPPSAFCLPPSLLFTFLDFKPETVKLRSMKQFQKDDVVTYYVDCEKNYRQWWDLDRSMAMHAGFWDETTKNLHEALMKENEVLANIARISASDRVLDAGCGFGGSAIYLAQKIGCEVVGINLGESQLQRAKQYAAQKKLARPPEFLVMDYMHTTFPDASFDVVWGIESICYAKDKSQFIREAWRLLKPGGRLIVADGFHVRNEYTPEEKRLLAKAVNGWAVDSMESIPNFARYLQETGFRNISQKDATPLVLPSSRRLFMYSFPAIAWSKLGEYLGWSNHVQTQDFVSYHYQYWTVRKGLAKYIIFCAEK